MLVVAEGGVPEGIPIKGAHGEGNGSFPPELCAEEGGRESMDGLPEERGGRGSGLPG